MQLNALCYQVSFNLAIEKNIDWKPDSTTKEGHKLGQTDHEGHCQFAFQGQRQDSL